MTEKQEQMEILDKNVVNQLEQNAKLHQVQKTGYRKWYTQCHVSDLIIQPSKKYICKRCGQSGHYFELCPTRENPNFKPLNLRKNPTGIPKKFLKPAETVSEIQNAFLTCGEFVCLEKIM